MGRSGAVSRIEAGKRTNPSPATLRAIADALGAEYRDLMKLAGYIEEVHDKDKFYELVFRNSDGSVVDVRRGVKEMFRRDEDWDILKDMAKKFLEVKRKW